MKNVLLIFCNGDIKDSYPLASEISNVFTDGGFLFDRAEILSNEDDIMFRRSLERYKDVSDNLVIINNLNLSFDIKKIISEVFETTLIENENAKKFVDSVAERQGTTFSENYYLLPIDATVIPNTESAEQGFLLDDKEFTLAYLPSNISQAKSMGERYVLPFFESKYGIKVRKLTLKYFGDRQKLVEVINTAIEQNDKRCKYSLEEKDGDFKITFNFPYEKNNISSPVIRQVVEKLKDNIYAEFDTTLQERLFQILNLKKLKISTAESFTAGRIISAIISNTGASNNAHEGIVCYSNQSKIDRVGVNANDLYKNGAVSSVVAYQMAAGLLKGGNCDVAIATTGFAGPNDEKTGLCYIAVGMKDGVHTYKFNFNGTRQQITEKAKNTALYLTIKKLKKL